MSDATARVIGIGAVGDLFPLSDTMQVTYSRVPLDASEFMSVYPAQSPPTSITPQEREVDTTVVQTSPRTIISLPTPHPLRTDCNVTGSPSPPSRAFDLLTQCCGYRMRFSRRSFLISPFFGGGRCTSGTGAASYYPYFFLEYTGNEREPCWP